MPPKSGRNPNRNTRVPRFFHWLPESLGPKTAKRKKFKPRNRQRTKEEIAEHEARIDEMIRSSYSVAEILKELNLHDNQLRRHVQNLRRQHPKETWRYKRLLDDVDKIYAHKLDLVYNLRREGLTEPEIEGLMGLDWGNSTRHLKFLRDSVKSEDKIRGLSGIRAYGGSQKVLLDREAEVVRAVYKKAKKSRIAEVRARAERLLPNFSGFERNRLQVAINTLKQLEESAKR